jgi:rubrerythrin
MPKFVIEQFERVVNVYEVEADNATQALLDFRQGMVGDFLGQTGDFPEAANDHGISFEELQDSGLDLELLRKEFNEDRNSEYLESIKSFQQDDENVYLCNECDAMHEDETDSCDNCPSESIRTVSKGDI